MKLASLIGAIALVAAGCAAKTAPAPEARVAAPKADATATRRRQTIAVLPFENNAVTGRERLDFLRDWLPDAIGSALAESGELRLIERRRLLEILQEQKLGASELASKDGRLRLGRIAGAQTMIFGGFTAIGESLRLDTRVVDVESGLVLRSAKAEGAPAEARDLSAKLAADVAKDLGVTVARRIEIAGVSDDRELRAAELYYEALALEKSGKTDEAVEGYRRVLELNRDDQEAREHLKKLLGASSR